MFGEEAGVNPIEGRGGVILVLQDHHDVEDRGAAQITGYDDIVYETIKGIVLVLVCVQANAPYISQIICEGELALRTGSDRKRIQVETDLILEVGMWSACHWCTDDDVLSP